jgi:hypothetical protein
MAGTVRWIRRIAGVALLFVFFTYVSETQTDASGVQREVRVGAWFSPWYVSTEKTVASSEAAEGGGSITSEDTHTTTTFTMASWSWPILLAALALFFWPSRKAPAGKPATPGPSPAR